MNAIQYFIKMFSKQSVAIGNSICYGYFNLPSIYVNQTKSKRIHNKKSMNHETPIKSFGD